jgi:hypothetical protein
LVGRRRARPLLPGQPLCPRPSLSRR